LLPGEGERLSERERERERVLVSGGAGGIGAAVCEVLHERGYAPVVGYHRTPDRAHALAARLGGEAIALDLSVAADIAACALAIGEHGAALAGVVLAASPPPALGPFGTISAEDMARQWQINVVGPQLLLAALVRTSFRARKQGAVVGVLTTAMGSGIGTAASNMGAYVIAKYGLEGVLAAAAADYPWLRVRAVRPGFTDTPMLAAFDARYLAMQRTREPFGTPAQVALEIVDALLTP